MEMTRKLPLSFEEFQSIYSKVTRLCVDLVIKNEQGVLLTLRQKNGWEGQWHLPGGTVHFRERIMEAVRRVGMEELGLTIESMKLKGYLEYPSEVEERGFGYSVSMVFLCKIGNEELKLDDQVEKFGFFKKLPENTIKEQKSFLIDILAG